MSAGSVIYNVRSIRVVDGEVATSTLNGDRFGLMFAGVAYYEAYGFSGTSLHLGHIFVYFYHTLEKCSFVVFFYFSAQLFIVLSVLFEGYFANCLMSYLSKKIG